MPELMELEGERDYCLGSVRATVAVAIALAGAACRKSVSGNWWGPLCGMGICFDAALRLMEDRIAVPACVVPPGHGNNN
jgi:hypothetical protein